MASMQEKHQQEAVSHESAISDLRAKIANREDEPDDWEERIKTLEAMLKDRDVALQQAQKSGSSAAESVDQLHEQLTTVKAQLVTVCCNIVF
jgi:chromosome segregation ATPase